MDSEQVGSPRAPDPAAGPAGPGDPGAAGGRDAQQRPWPARLGAGSRRGRLAWGAAAVALILIAVISVAGGGAGAQRPALRAANGFSLPVLGHPGSRISLAALAGRPVMVNFFASWCPPCKRETPLIARFYRGARGTIAIIGVDANDEAGPAAQFLRQAGVTYPVGFDPFPARATTSYGVFQLPQTFFLDARHRIVQHVFGALTLKEITADVALMGGRPGPLAGAKAQARAATRIEADR